MKIRKLIIVCATIMVTMVIILGLFVSGVLVSSSTVSSSGIIATANIGIYSDSACTQKITSITWGTVSPGSSTTETVYVENLGTTPLTLSLATSNWNPTTANGPITVSWNQAGATLAVNQVLTATLTLSVSSSISGITSFSMNVVISGTA